jgi:hypothetical protein
VWSAGPVQFIWVLAWSGWRDCTGFLFSGSVVVGAVRLKCWEVVWLSFHFLYFAGSYPGVWLSVVGFCSSILVFLGYIWHYMWLRML